VIGGTHSRLASPTARDTDPYEQTDARKPTDEHGCDGSVKVGDRDGRGHRESANAAKQGPCTIFNREPPQLDNNPNGRADSDHSPNDCAAKQSSLAGCVAQDRSDYSPESSKSPRGGEQSKGLQSDLISSGKWVFA